MASTSDSNFAVILGKQKGIDNSWETDFKIDSGKDPSETKLKLYEDQQKGTGSLFSDLSIFCEGGFILAHKIVMCPASKFIADAIINQDPLCRTASVDMLQYNVHCVIPVINFIYTGKMVFKPTDFEVVQMVVKKMELDTGDIQFSRAIRANMDDRQLLQKVSFVPLMEYEGIPTSNSKPVRFATVVPQ